jgi:hypothetical protein
MQQMMPMTNETMARVLFLRPFSAKGRDASKGRDGSRGPALPATGPLGAGRPAGLDPPKPPSGEGVMGVAGRGGGESCSGGTSKLAVQAGQLTLEPGAPSFSLPQLGQ